MIYSLSFILENNAFLAILGVSILSGLISFYFLNKEKY
jgi:LPXTG-motif cell wall-anchored protein